MGDLVLNSLEIRNFRGFRDLRIERLGRVNLIVGKNGVGKTALLEALQLYAERGDTYLIQELLQARGEHRNFPLRQLRNGEGDGLTIKYLFYGRADLGEHIKPIQIGPMGVPSETFTIGIDWDKELMQNPGPTLIVQVNKGPDGIPLRVSGYAVPHPEFKKIPYIFIPASGLNDVSVSGWWDSTALTDREDDVIKALQLIAPQVKRIDFIGGQSPNDQRLPMMRLSGIVQPLPLGSLGEGMKRMLGLALVLVNSADGLLLVDEIESGIHYSVQPDMWHLIFETARRLNVQVFATTHSWDCIEAFQQAALEDTQAEGMAFRLQNKNDDIIAIPYSEHELMIATREQIEVR